MQNFIEKKNNLTDEEVNELLYYYEQGIIMGKEEAKIDVINNLLQLNMDINTISKVTNYSIKQIKQIIE